MRRRCTVCGSREWHKEPSSGLIACSEGHVLQNYRNEATERDDELGPHAIRKRALKSGRKKKGKGSKANPELYHGARGRLLYFQCLQIILRQQIRVLIEEWKFPAEFEIVCRDVWALHCSFLPEPPTDEGEDLSSEESERSEESSESSESSEEEKPAKKKSSKFDGPANTIAVLMIASRMMRLPMTINDFIQSIERYEIPYLEPIRVLPEDLKRHLTHHKIQKLTPKDSPNEKHIEWICKRLERKLLKEYGIKTPFINITPIGL